MNTKKAIWVKRPDCYIKTSLHSISYTNETKSSVFFTIGEEGEIQLKAKGGDGVAISLVFLHTPSDHIVFSKEEIATEFFGFKSSTPLNSFQTIKMSKVGEKISFYSEDNLLLSIENPAFLGSASFGVQAIGAGSVEIEVF